MLQPLYLNFSKRLWLGVQIGKGIKYINPKSHHHKIQSCWKFKVKNENATFAFVNLMIHFPGGFSCILPRMKVWFYYALRVELTRFKHTKHNITYKVNYRLVLRLNQQIHLPRAFISVIGWLLLFAPQLFSFSGRSAFCIPCSKCFKHIMVLS